MVFRTAVTDLRRLRTIAGVLARHGFEGIGTRIWRRAAPGDPDLPLPPGPQPKQSSDQHTTAERRFRMVLEELGPTFIKLGQILSTRPDLLPARYIVELQLLQDRVEPLPTEQIRESIEASLGKPINELFSRFEDTPLATASIAQTHRAWLHDGSCVAVKVQRPDIEGDIRSDLDLLQALAHLLEATIEEARLYDPVSIAREFEAAITKELDFSLELSNMQTFHRHFSDYEALVIPSPCLEYSSKTVLTMGFLEGTPLNVLPESQATREALALTLLDAWYQMVFHHGLFHADPHPGNLLLLDGSRLGLLDFGLVGRLSDKTRETIVTLCLGIVMKDVTGLARMIYKLGVAEDRIALAGFRDAIQTLLDRYVTLDLSEVHTGALLTDLLDVAVRFRIRLDPEYALLAKAGATIEGLVRQLHPNINLLEISRPYAKELLAKRYAPDQLLQQLMRLGVGFSSFVQDVPAQIDQVLLDLEGGRLTLRVEHPGLDSLGEELNALATRVFMGFCTAALIVAGALLLQSYPGLEFRGVPVLPTLAFVGAGFLSLAALVWHLISLRRGRKIRLREWAAFWRRMRRGEEK